MMTWAIGLPLERRHLAGIRLAAGAPDNWHAAPGLASCLRILCIAPRQPIRRTGMDQDAKEELTYAMSHKTIRRYLQKRKRSRGCRSPNSSARGVRRGC